MKWEDLPDWKKYRPFNVGLVIFFVLMLWGMTADAAETTIQTRYLGGTQSPASWTIVEVPSAPWVLRYQTVSGTYVADSPALFAESWWSVDIGREVGSFSDSTAIAYVGYLDLNYVPLGPTGGGIAYQGFMVGLRGTMPMADTNQKFVYDIALKPFNTAVSTVTGPAIANGFDLAIGVEFALSPTTTATAGYMTREWHSVTGICSWPGDGGYCVWSGPYLGMRVALP